MVDQASLMPEVTADRLNASSPLDTMLMERKVARQAARQRSSSPLDTLLLERRMSRQALHPLPAEGPAGVQSHHELLAMPPLIVAHGSRSQPLITPLLRQTVRARLQRVIEQQQQQAAVDQRGSHSPELVDSYPLASFQPSAAAFPPPPSAHSSMPPSPNANDGRVGMSSPVDEMLLERKVIRQQRKRAEFHDDACKEDVSNCPELWLSGVEISLEEASSSRSSPLSPRDPVPLWSAPWGSPRKQARASPGA